MICVDIVGGSVIEILTTDRYEQKVIGVMRFFGFKFIKSAKPLENILIILSRHHQD